MLVDYKLKQHKNGAEKFGYKKDFCTSERREGEREREREREREMERKKGSER